MEDSTQDQRLGIQSVEVAAKILSALAQGGGILPLGMLARSSGMSSAKVHRYLISLARSGLVAQCPSTGQYKIGPLAVTLGLSGVRMVRPLRLALEALPELRDAADETVSLAMLGDSGPVIIGLEEAQRTMALNVRVGAVLPVTTSAIGRVFAAFGSNATLEAQIEKELTGAGKSKAQLRREFDAEIELIKSQGYSVIAGGLLSGTVAIAAPVFDFRRKLVAVMCVAGSEATIGVPPKAFTVKVLREAALDVSKAIGYSEETAEAA